MSKWGMLEARLREIAAALVPEPRWAFRNTDPLVALALGKWLAAASKIERRFVTLLGSSSVDLVEPWFDGCRRLQGFWSASCVRGGEAYTLKVVLSDRTLNSTLRRRVERESRALPRPVVLALVGRDAVIDIGRAVMLSGPAAWRWLTGEKDAYEKFLDMMYRVFMDARRRLRREFKEAWREWLEEYLDGKRRTRSSLGGGPG